MVGTLTESKKTVMQGKDVVATTLRAGAVLMGENYANATYSFADDGGAIGTLNLTLDHPIPVGAVVLGYLSNVSSAYTSGGSATISFGIQAAADLVAATAFDNAINLTTAQIQATSSGGKKPVVIATEATSLIMVIAGATITAGASTIKIRYLVVA